MRKMVIAGLLAAAVFATGCDAFRKLAGRPTSADIAAKREVIEMAEAARHKARLDSLAKVEKQMTDSLAVLDSLKNMRGTALRNPSAMGGIYTGDLQKKYYIVVGSFMDKGNAGYLKNHVEESGYEATLIYFRNGYTAVGICPEDNLVEEYENLKKVKTEKFCPEGVWILVNN